MIGRFLSRRGLRDERGVTVIEFAFVAPVMLFMLMGFFDLAHRSYAAAVLQGAVQKAGRDSTLEIESKIEDGEEITVEEQIERLDAVVEEQVARVVGTEAEGTVFTSTRLAYTDFDQVGDAEVFKDKTPFNGHYDPLECFEDVNGNGHWDSDLGRTGQGSAQDAVLYRMTVTYPRLFPFAIAHFGGATDTVTASTVLRNQPYGDQVIPVVTKCT